MFWFNFACVLLLWNLKASEGATELLQNPGFEDGTNHWNLWGFTSEAQTAVVHGGHSALKSSG
ncbi:Anti-sigma-I factor RsgI6, partial [Biomphalaria glabrata]